MEKLKFGLSIQLLRADPGLIVPWSEWKDHDTSAVANTIPTLPASIDKSFLESICSRSYDPFERVDPLVLSRVQPLPLPNETVVR